MHPKNRTGIHTTYYTKRYKPDRIEPSEIKSLKTIQPYNPPDHKRMHTDLCESLQI